MNDLVFKLNKNPRISPAGLEEIDLDPDKFDMIGLVKISFCENRDYKPKQSASHGHKDDIENYLYFETERQTERLGHRVFTEDDDLGNLEYLSNTLIENRLCIGQFKELSKTHYTVVGILYQEKPK